MNINMKLKLSAENHEWLCFKHAVKLAMDGMAIYKEIDDFDSEYYTGHISCVICHEEKLK